MRSLIIDGNRLMMHLADWWYSSFGQEETEDAKAIRAVMNEIENNLGEFRIEPKQPDSGSIDSEQLEIIKCKDCKHYKAKQGGLPWKDSRKYCNRSVTLVMNPDDFCSFAERKEDE